MRIRRALLQTTMLAGMAGASYLSAGGAKAEDSLFAPNYPAVDGVNAKFDVRGGSFLHDGLVAARGALTVPLGHSFGLEVIGKAGSLGGKFLGKAAGRVFWRNPEFALFGIYGSYTHWNEFGGVNVGRVGPEAEFYLGRWTLDGIVGAEFGNKAVGPLTAVTLANPTFLSGGLIGYYAPVYDLKTRFFDEVSVRYYWTDNLQTFIGHRYVGGEHALALGGESALPIGLGDNSKMVSAFVEGRIGSGDYQGVWGGVRFYFGQKDKTLIRRHREDDAQERDDVTPLTPNVPQFYQRTNPLNDGYPN